MANDNRNSSLIHENRLNIPNSQKYDTFEMLIILYCTSVTIVYVWPKFRFQNKKG